MEESDERGLFPVELHMGDKRRNEHQIARAVAHNLVRDVHVATLGIFGLRRHGHGHPCRNKKLPPCLVAPWCTYMAGYPTKTPESVPCIGRERDVTRFLHQSSFNIHEVEQYCYSFWRDCRVQKALQFSFPAFCTNER